MTLFSGMIALLLAMQAAPASEGASVTSLIRADDYPAEALRKGEQGTVHYALRIGTDGRPKSCSVTQSSGSERLDQATCKILMERAKFAHALDHQGNPAEDVFSGQIRWQFR